MALEFRLPDIGEGVVEGEIVRWLIAEGDMVKEDQPMVEVMTDKATVEIPSPKAGRVAKIMVPSGKICAVGQVMLVIEDKSNGAQAPAPPKPARPSPAEANPSQAQAATAAPSAQTLSPDPGKRALATPATRQLARQLAVNINLIRGTGPGGRVTKDDVRAQHEKALAGAAPAYVPPSPKAQPPTPAASMTGDERIPFRGVRKKIAENMSRSKLTAAHFTYVEECDVSELSALRNRAKKRAEERGIKLSFLPFVVKAVCAGLKKYPIVNATLDETTQEIVLRKRYHIGVAAATEAGLVVPVLRDADQLSLFEIAKQLDALSEKARTGKASREELTGSTFTISSLGTLGGVLATPIINHPEVAILGLHKIKDTPVVRDGQIVIRAMMNLSISLDHRIVDGYEGALFLNHVIGLLADPTLMFMEMV